MLSLLSLYTAIHAWIVARSSGARRATDDAGQATAEYAMLILGAATVAMLVLAWATKTGKIAMLMDLAVDSVTSKFK
jgi:hypothetical protein